MTPRSREALRLMMGFSGRVSGAVVSLLIVRIVGVGVDANPLYLAMGVYTVASSLMLGLLETNTIALWANRKAARGSDLLAAGALFGTVVGSAAFSLFFLASFVIQSLQASVGIVAVLVLSAPLTGVYAVFLGLSVTRRSWVSPASGAWVKVLLAAGLAVPLYRSLGLVGVAVAGVLGDLARLVPLSWSREVFSKGRVRPSTDLIRHAAVQTPSSLAGTANPLLDRVVVAQLSLGSLGVLDLAEKTYGLAALAFTQGFLPSLFQRWAGAGDRESRTAAIRRHALLALPAGAVLSVVVAAVVMVVGPWVAGPSLDGHVTLFRQASAAYLLALPAYLSTQVLVRLVVLEGRGRLLNETALVQLAVNVLADLWFGAVWGLIGVAIATSLVAWVGLGLVWWVSRPLGRAATVQQEGAVTNA